MSADAFLSFPSAVGPWVAELCAHLQRFGVTVFRENQDVPSGKSLNVENQAHLDRAGFLVVVLTPEALVRLELAEWWSSFKGRTQAGLPPGLVVPLLLADTPLPPALSDIQPIDFRHEENYLEGLSRLLETLGRRAPAAEQLQDLPIPSLPQPALPPLLRSRLIEVLRPLAVEPVMLRALAGTFTLPSTWAQGPFTSSPECAASALLVLAMPGQPREAALRVVRELRATEFEMNRHVLEELEDKLLGLAVIEHGDIALHRYLKEMADTRLRPSDYLEIGQLQPVYIQLKLQCESLRAGLGPDASGEMEGLWPLVIRALRDHPTPGRPWLLRGDPGSGKSALLRRLVADLAGEPGASLSAPRRPVPVYFPLPQLMQGQAEPLERIESRLRRIWPASEVAGLREALEAAGKEGRLIVLLDGLDEVPSNQRAEAIEMAFGFARRWTRSLVVLSSRRIRLPHQGDFQIVDIQPLDRDRRLRLLAEWLWSGAGAADTDQAERVLKQLESEPGIWGLTENPLFLSLVALVLKRDGEDTAAVPRLRHRRELYDRVFRLLLDGRHREPPNPMPFQSAVRGSLRFFACSLTERDIHSLPAPDLEAILLRDAAAVWRDLQKHDPWQGRPRAFLDEMAERTGILASYDGGEDWRFQHRAFREALVAESLGEAMAAAVRGEGSGPPGPGSQPASGWESFRQELEGRALAGDRWVEPYVLCVEASDDPDSLIHQIVRINRTFGLRALAGVKGLKPSTLQEILALTEDWKERREIFLKLINQAQRPEEGVRLLQRVMATTRNGNDLFFIEQALTEAWRQWPDLRELIGETVGALFSHLGSPDPSLFRLVRTAQGDAQLWCEVPTGRFLMGHDGGREEEPVHLVTFDSPFQLSAVPVTRRQYAAFDPEHDPSGWLPDLPVVRVTWYAAQAFCRWLSRSGWPGARLPTELEWEYACAAGGSQEPWWCSLGELPGAAWFRDNSEGRCHAVATRQASPLGLYDLHGNVHEWCLDRWQSGSGAPEASEDDLNAARPLRGGCYADPAEGVRRTARKAALPWEESEMIGFRIVLPAGGGSGGEEQTG